jgi:hypothetical protein
MGGEMLNQLRKNMDKTGRVSPAEQRMMGAAIAELADEMQKLNNLLVELNLMICSNPMINYGSWLRKKPAAAIIISAMVLVAVIAVIEIVGVRGVGTFLIARIPK